MTFYQNIDQTGYHIKLDTPPKRIVSLVPSQTELLFYLGLDKKIIGITKFCIEPKKKIQHKEKIGGTKKCNIKKILSLTPDLIIGNKEENDQESILALRKHVPVWISDITTFNDALLMIEQVGKLVNCLCQAKKLIQTIQKNFKQISEKCQKNVLYFIWRKPYMVVGNNTFINDMLHQAGYKNACAYLSRYPTLKKEELADIQADLVFLSSEPFPFKKSHVDEFRAIFPHTPICLVDGQMFSWYGPRLQYAPNYFKNLPFTKTT